MARRRRKVTRRRRAVAVNPRRVRRVRRARRRHSPIVARSVNPSRRHRRRHVGRRRNPSGMRIGQIFKDMVYGAGGAIATRVGAGILQGFVPASFASSPLAVPVVQAAVAATLVRWGGKKFLGPQQGDLMMLGGLISAGLALADAYLPNVQGQLSNILRAPVMIAAPAATSMAGYRDVEELPDSAFAGLGDVEDVPSAMFG